MRSFVQQAYNDSATLSLRKSSCSHLVAGRPSSGEVRRASRIIKCSGQQGRGRAAQKKSGGLLVSILNLSAAPYSSYVPEPKLFLHHASAEAKQLWMVGVLLIVARAAPPVRIAAVGLLASATMVALPKRLWDAQLRRLGGLCAILFVFTAIGSDVAPVLVDRSLHGGAVGEAAAALPASMAAFSAKYRYVLLKLGPMTVTRKGVNLAITVAALTFTALQSASLCLTTTPPEHMATALGTVLRPLGWVGVPVKELILLLLLSLRFLSTVFEECRNLCLGLASRGITWSALGTREVLTIVLGMFTKLFANLMGRCDNIAVAMTARGFRGPDQHVLYTGGRKTAFGGAVDICILAALVCMAALGYFVA